MTFPDWGHRFEAFQCFDTVNKLGDMNSNQPIKKPVQLIPKGSVPEQLVKEDQGNQLTRFTWKTFIKRPMRRRSGVYTLQLYYQAHNIMILADPRKRLRYWLERHQSKQFNIVQL